MRKQGRADRSGSYGGKVEPKPHGMNLPGVSQIGQAMGAMRHGESISHTSAATPIRNGPGYKAPMNASHSAMKSGSQGRH